MLRIREVLSVFMRIKYLHWDEWDGERWLEKIDRNSQVQRTVTKDFISPIVDFRGSGVWMLNSVSGLDCARRSVEVHRIARRVNRGARGPALQTRVGKESRWSSLTRPFDGS